MLREVTKPYGNVRVESFQGLLVDFCRSAEATVVVKGLRAVSDFDYELQMAQMNIGPGRRRDAVHADQPAELVHLVEPGQGRGEVGRRRQRPRARRGRPAGWPTGCGRPTG